MTPKVNALPTFSGKQLGKVMDKAKMNVADLLREMHRIKFETGSDLKPSRSLIENWLTDSGKPSDDYMVLLTKALDCNESDLRQ